MTASELVYPVDPFSKVKHTGSLWASGRLLL